jgi:hypothetical protein
MKIDGLTVNPDIPASMFARQRMEGVPSYDLATGRLDRPVSLQQTRGVR